MKIVSTTKRQRQLYFGNTRSATREGVVARASESLKSSKCTAGSNAPLNVPVVMPEHAAGLSEAKDTVETVKVKLVYRRDRDGFLNTHGLLPEMSRDGQ